MTLLDQEVLKSILSYDANSGEFTWLKNTRRLKAGDKAGTTNGSGYRQICIAGKIYNAHRLSWLYVHGKIPEFDIDHIDGNRLNNSLANLRHVSRSVNLQNQRSIRAGKISDAGLGASFIKRTGKWHSRIKVNGRQISLGCFTTSEEAHLKYLDAKRKLHEGCSI